MTPAKGLARAGVTVAPENRGLLDSILASLRDEPKAKPEPVKKPANDQDQDDTSSEEALAATLRDWSARKIEPGNPGTRERRAPGRPQGSKTRVKDPNKHSIADLINGRELDENGDTGIFTDGIPVDAFKAALAKTLRERNDVGEKSADARIERLRKSSNGQIAAYLAEQERVAKVVASADRAAQKAAMDALVREFEAEGHPEEQRAKLKRAAELVDSDDPSAHLEDGTPREVVTITGNQPSQTAFLKDMQPGFVLAQGGWGSGKSWSGVRKFAYLHALNTESEGMIVAPTREDLVRDIVPKFIDFCTEMNWQVTRREQPLRLTVLGRQIHCMSAEEPRRIASFTVGHGWVDEGAKVRESNTDPLDDAPTQIRARMRCQKAKLLQLIVTTTPEGVNTWVERDFVGSAERGPLNDHRVYFLPTKGNSALYAGYVAHLMEAIPADLVEQYLEGKAVDYVADRAHKTFTNENLSTLELDPRLPVHIGLDFNVDPMSWVAFQEMGGGIHAVGEVFIEGGTTIDVAIKAANELGWGKAIKIIFHPDKSSKSRSTTGDGEFVSLMKLARAYKWNAHGSAFGNNPPVIARIGKLARAIHSADGQRKFFVNPKKCPRLTTELRTVGRRQDGDYDPGKNKDKGHILSAAGYAVYDLIPDRITTAALVPYSA
jgi:hypothetical protein